MKLTINQRHLLNRYVRKLTCTLKLRMVVDAFFDDLEFSDTEFNTYEIKVTPITGEITSNNEEYSVDIVIPDEVIKSIKRYIDDYDIKETKDNEVIQKMLTIFKQVV